MDTPPLCTLLEEEIVSALLANFAQLLPSPNRTWLVDAEGCLVGFSPAEAQDADTQDLLVALDQVRQFARIAQVPLGIAAPIFLRGETVGALIATMPGTVDPQRVAALRFLSRVVSLLAENSLNREELLGEALDRYRELNLLHRVGETIVADLDLARVTRLILDECIDLVQVPEGAVMLRDPEKGRLTVLASCGLGAGGDINYGVPPGYELAERAVQRGETETLERPDPGSRKEPLNAILCVPLEAKEEVLGVISLAHTDPEQTFRASDIDLIKAIARQAAVAIKNARTFSELSTRYAELDEANRRLLDLEKRRSSFLGAVADELHGAFAVIDASLESIERQGTQEWSEPQRAQWDHMVESVQAARTVVDNLACSASLHREQGDLALGEVDFPRLVNQVVGELEPVARSRDLTLSVKGDEEMAPVWADERRLGEAIYHLVRNAIESSRTGGKVRVRYWADGKTARFEVQDTGVGIPEEKLKLLREPVSQVAVPSKRDGERLGPGLDLVRNVVYAHGGRVTASSYAGVGSTFRFWLPISGAQGTAS